MSLLNDIQDFYQRKSTQETSLSDIQTVSSPPNLDGFLQLRASLDEVPTAICRYPDWDNAETAPSLMPPTIKSTYPSGFDSGGPLPSIFAPERNPAKALHLTDPKNGIMQDTVGLNLSEIADVILDSADFAEIEGRFAYYEAPIWRFLRREDVGKVIARILYKIAPDISRRLLKHHASELYDKLTASPEIKRLRTIPTLDYHMLCCKDGMYRWPQSDVLRHNSRYYRFSYLNISAEDIAPQVTPYFDIFLDNVTQGDAPLRQLVLEVIGVILSGYPCKKFFVFQGASNSGKSQLASFLRDVLGRTACYAVNDVNQLSNTRVTGALPGKLLLLCSDVPDTELKAPSVAVIKELTGGDPIFGDPKYQQPFYFNSTAKLLFLSNFPLRLRKGTSDDAFLDRMLQVPFRFSVPKERQIDDLHKRLVGEAGGIIWDALEALQALEERGGVFTKVEIEPDDVFAPASPTEQDRIRAFVRECCVMDQGASITVAELYSAFLGFDRQEYPDSMRVESNIFSRILNQSGLPIQSYRTASDRGYRGIRLNSGLPSHPL